MGKSFVVLKVKSGLTVLKDWYGVSLEDESALIDVYNDYATGNL